MSLNHKQIANTKFAVKEVIKRMDSRLEEFVDALVQARPEEFQGADDRAIDPFVIIEMITESFRQQFTEFTNKVKTGEIVITPEIKERVESKIIDFNSSKKKGETTH